MRAVLQRVSEASVTVEGQIVGQIEAGLLALIGVEAEDADADAFYIAGKIADLRLFGDEGDPGGIERSLVEVGGAALVVSQFTLLGDCRKGRRPSWSQAAPPDEGKRLYEKVVALLQERGVPTRTGTFRAQMEVRLVGDGPVTVLIDSRKRF